MAENDDYRPPNWLKAVVSSAVILVIAFLIVGSLAQVAGGALGAIGLSEVAAGVAGMASILMAATMGLGLGSRYPDVKDEEQRKQRRLDLWSIMGLAPMGISLWLLALAGPGGVVSPPVALGTVLVLLALAIASTIAMWRGLDEYQRQLSNRSGAISFNLLSIVGGGWAILTQLGFAAGPAPLDWLTMLLALPLVAAFVAAGTRGDDPTSGAQ